MQRLKPNERGAVAVIVALSLLALMGAAALAVDVGSMHYAKVQLQTGADAAALAVAQDCARDNCDTRDATTQSMVGANFAGDGATGAVLQIDETAGTVSVQSSAVRKHSFAPAIGIHESEIAARASARWGYPTGGIAVMPLAFSWCELEAQVGITPIKDATGKIIGVDIPGTTPERTIYLTKSSSTACTGPSNNLVPGGFGWLVPSLSNCDKTASVIDGWVGSDTGNNVPSICSPADFDKQIGQTVLLPIFDRYDGSGSNAKYQIFGYAAFTLKNYYFAGQYKTTSPPCGGSERCISGSFDRFVDLAENFDYSPDGPRLGAAVVALTG